MSGLKNGNYFIEFHEDMLIRTILFKIENNEILLEEKEEIILYRPFIRMKGAIFSICRSILDKNGDLEILLYDDSKNLIYEGLLDHNYPKGRMYDISCLDKGNYQLVMKSKGTVFIESIEKE